MTKEKYCGEMKVIDTPDKSYLLGLIYSDGTIIYKEGISYSCRIKLNDLELLEKIVKTFPFFCTPQKQNYNKTYLIYCYSKQLVLDLMNHGLVVSKSIKNVNKLGNPGNLKYPGDFIRGVFDGDGNLYVDKDNNKRITIYCNCKSFIDYLISYYQKHQIKYCLVHRNTKGRNIYDLKVGKQESVKTLVSFMSNKSSIYLERKWQKLFNLVWKDIASSNKAAAEKRRLLVRTLKHNINCPVCKSNRNITIRNSKNYDYLQCKSCNHKHRVHLKLDELSGNPTK